MISDNFWIFYLCKTCDWVTMNVRFFEMLSVSERHIIILFLKKWWGTCPQAQPMATPLVWVNVVCLNTFRPSTVLCKMYLTPLVKYYILTVLSTFPKESRNK